MKQQGSAVIKCRKGNVDLFFFAVCLIKSLYLSTVSLLSSHKNMVIILYTLS